MHLGVDVAVKQVLLPMEGKGPQAAERVARAAREARNTARLRDCPNIVTVHDVHIEYGAPWIVMQLVKGESLAERVAHRGPLAENHAVALARDLLRALAAAHAAGIVHRDGSPATSCWPPTAPRCSPTSASPSASTTSGSPAPELSSARPATSRRSA